MDFGTIGGIAAGFFLVIFVAIGDPAKIVMFLDVPSTAIVVGGVVTYMFTAYPMSRLKMMPSIIKNVVFPQKRDIPAVIKSIISFAEQARREGILALENRLPEVSDPFLKKGIQLAVDGTEQGLIRDILQTEMDYLEERHKVNAAMFMDMAGLAPAYGMLGTFVGLVLMLANLSDPTSIGPAMAVALITSFYGSIIANMLATPIAVKLSVYSRAEMMEKRIMIDGILSLQAGENPRIVEWKLLSFLDPGARLNLEAEKEKERERKN